jgi:hypothetical protein
MTVSLGGIALSDHLTLDIGPAAAAISQRRLIGGASCVQADGSSGGRVLTLAGINHWTLSQVEQIRALESIAATVELVHHRGTFKAVISSTADVSLTRNYANPPAAALCSGSITLIEV